MATRGRRNTGTSAAPTAASSAVEAGVSLVPASSAGAPAFRLEPRGLMFEPGSTASGHDRHGFARRHAETAWLAGADFSDHAELARRGSRLQREAVAHRAGFRRIIAVCRQGFRQHAPASLIERRRLRRRPRCARGHSFEHLRTRLFEGQRRHMRHCSSGLLRRRRCPRCRCGEFRADC